ncbi:MAG: hypothetical protein M0T84_08610 [Betaproteobacteria bacterium]|nr:hypothetical protein [Betaproteobacteria bacterium]
MLAGMARAGWPIDDPSMAPIVAYLAFIWKRSANWVDFQTQIRALQAAFTDEMDRTELAIRSEIREVGDGVKDLRDSLKSISEKMLAEPASPPPPKINIEELTRALGPFLQAPAQVTQHYDVADSVKDALRKTFQWTWVAGALAVALLVSILWTRMYIQDSHQIEQLKMQMLQAVPRTDHRRP